MKKIALVLALLGAMVVNAHAEETVKLAIGDWEPYTSSTNPKGKLLEVVVTEAFKLEGVVVKYEYFPWKRSITNVENGDFDGTFPWNKTPERVSSFHIPQQSLLKDDAVYFHLKSKAFDWKTIDDLKNYSVGVTVGYKEEKIYKDKGIKADAVPSEDTNFKKMLAGRIDVYQTSKVVGYSMINKMFTPDEAKLFTNHATPVEQAEYFILFSKKTPNGKALADKFDSGLKKLKDSGAYKKILADYGV
jgi:polar amino acid transport system substrate-binding protein